MALGHSHSLSLSLLRVSNTDFAFLLIMKKGTIHSLMEEHAVDGTRPTGNE